MHRLRTVRLAALLVGLAMVAAACGGGDDEGGDTSGGSAQIQQGGTLNYAADQEPTGFNNNTSKDNGTSVANIVISMYPSAFHSQPDFTVKLNDEFLDSAEQTSEDPQTIVYKIKQNAIWSDDTPVTADDFIYFWENLNGTIKDNDVASTTGYDQIESVEGSDNGKTVTVVFKTPFADWKSHVLPASCPSHYIKERPGGWNTGLDKEPEKIPSAGWFKVESYTAGQSLTLVRNDKYFGAKANLDSVVFRFLPESTTQPAALQNNEVDLIYPQPQLDQVTQVEALPDVTSEINFGLSYEHFDFNFKNELLADEAVRKAIATGMNIRGAGRPHGQAVQRPGDPARQPDLPDRPAGVPGPHAASTARVTPPRRPSCWRTPATPRAPTASTPRAARRSPCGSPPPPATRCARPRASCSRPR